MHTVDKDLAQIILANNKQLYKLSFTYIHFVFACILTYLVISCCPVLPIKSLLIKHQFIYLVVSFLIVWYTLKKIKNSKVYYESLLWMLFLVFSIGFLYKQESILFAPADQSKLDIVFKSLTIFILCSIAGFNIDYDKRIFDKVFKVFSVSLLISFILNLIIDLSFIYKSLLLITTILQITSMSKYIYEKKQLHHLLVASVLFLSFYSLVLSLI